MPVEVPNAIHRRILRGELSVGNGARLITRLLDSSLELHQQAGLHARALQLATELNQNAVYDAHYLALAEIVGCEVWTADERLYRVARPNLDTVRWIGELDGSEDP